MAQEELEAALRRSGEQQAREIWLQAEDEAEQLRQETAERLERRRQAETARCEQEVAGVHETARAEAQRQAQWQRLLAEQNLAERLHKLATELLGTLASRGGEQLFAALAAEIPQHDWCQVVVNPRDRQSAEQQFPGAEISCSDKISGGLSVHAADGRIQIINTLEKRLEHLWPQLLPELMQALRQMAGDNEAVT